MAQGHAISLLARAYYHSKGDKRYLRAALDGLKLFRIPSYQGGVLATFLGKYAWYEEYPTTPHSFVLNGFIYSLLGLYDLNSTAPANQSNEAAVLFEQGMASLKKMLLLYDTGSGTSYDLRHFTLGKQSSFFFGNGVFVINFCFISLTLCACRHCTESSPLGLPCDARQSAAPAGHDRSGPADLANGGTVEKLHGRQACTTQLGRRPPEPTVDLQNLLHFHFKCLTPRTHTHTNYLITSVHYSGRGGGANRIDLAGSEGKP